MVSDGIRGLVSELSSFVAGNPAIARAWAKAKSDVDVHDLSDDEVMGLVGKALKSRVAVDDGDVPSGITWPRDRRGRMLIAGMSPDDTVTFLLTTGAYRLGDDDDWHPVGSEFCAYARCADGTMVSVGSDVWVPIKSRGKATMCVVRDVPDDDTLDVRILGQNVTLLVPVTSAYGHEPPMGADGRTVLVGDDVWCDAPGGDGDGSHWRVIGILPRKPYCVDAVNDAGDNRQLKARWLTHHGR